MRKTLNVQTDRHKIEDRSTEDEQFCFTPDHLLNFCRVRSVSAIAPLNSLMDRTAERFCYPLMLDRMHVVRVVLF